MTFPTDAPHPHAPQAERDAALRSFGLTGPDPELDAFATQLAQEAGVPYAMVNIFGRVTRVTRQWCTREEAAPGPAHGRPKQQFFGLHTPGDDSDLPVVGRSMPLDHGFCPEVVDRKKALVLPDVFSSPRFAGNTVVDLIGIRTYAGAPLIHGDMVLGTVCFVGREERDLSTGRDSLALIKQRRDDVMNFVYQRAGIRP